ncbi:PKD domain-containing protein [Marivirga harenae]|uniref:PKD domain-containing protein n=1 Tax=Marivirga harenae TaxID=2010992 RepID=UPI0026DF3426|nr:PKD domain-containing protein [Marivirga harenae]WKV11601.1 PKD domain-containing protein [Marivirga harenae]
MGVIFVSTSNVLKAQFTCADASFGAGNGQQIRVEGAAGLGTFCAPVTVDWYISFDASIPVGADVDVIVDWGDGTDNTYNTNNFGTTWELSDGNGATFTVGSQTYAGTTVARKIYPTNENVCFYDITARLVIDGNVCAASTIINKVNYWDTDEDIPGNVNIDPILIQVCAGDQVTVNFDDNTTFNCVNPADTDNPNEDLRNVRWTYNTTDGAAPFGRINDVLLSNGVTLDGSNIGDQDYIPPQADVPGSDVNTIEEYPAIVGPGDAVSTTLDLTVPATATVGQVFEIKLENWGPCNPLGGPIPVIERYAIIEIVEPPQGLDFTISTDGPGLNQKITFCPGEDIRLRGSSTNQTPDFVYSWEIFDGPNATDPLIFDRTNDQFTWLSDEVGDLQNAFSSSGDKLIRMYIQNSDTDLTGNCTVFEDKLIEIIETPTPTIGTDDLSGGGTDISINAINLCEVELPIDFTFTDETPDRNASTESRWTVFDNNDMIIFGGGAYGAQTAAADNPVGLMPFTFPTPGHFKVVLEIRDGTTSCEASDTVNIFIYDTPEADFETDDVCAGDDDPSNRTQFFNISDANNGINPQVNGDEVVRWVWDFSYDVVAGFNNERDVNNNNPFQRFLDGTDGAEPTESQPGFYDVALVVETTNGCTDTVEYVVEVKHNPLSDLEASYTNDYEANLAGDPYSGDPICPGTLLTFINTTDESLNDPSVAPVDYELQIDSLGTTIFREIGAPGDVNESVSPNIFFNNTGSNEIYTIELVANGDNGCSIISAPITVTVLPGSASGFEVFDEPTFTNAYDPIIEYCSPYEFYFQIDNPTDNLLDPGDSLVWEVFDGSTLLGGDTLEFGEANYDQFSFEFNNDFPSIAAINYTVVLQPFVDGVCVNNSQRTIRVLPRPSSDFTPTNTVVTCDSVTYYFEAVQPGLLTYDWQVQPTTDTLSTQNDGVDFWVSYNRPDVGDPNVNVEVRLQTTNPFNCVGDLSDPFNDTILPKDDINVILDTVGNELCTPAPYGFVNNTTDPVPAGTEWQLIIKNLDINDSTIINGSTLAGNEEFRESDPADIFEYTFSESANYEIRLNALLPSTCDVASDPPISLSINESPTVDFDTNIDEGCAPFSFSIINETSSVPSGSDFDLSYEVRRPNGTLVAGYSGTVIKGPSNPAGLNSLTLSNLTVPAGSPYIDYEVILIAETVAGCTAESSQTIRVFQEPDIDFDVISTNPACEEDYNFDFEVVTNNINVADYELLWSWGDGQTLVTEEDTIVNHTFSNRASFFGSDTYTVTLSIETEYGCIASVSKPVNLNPRVQAGFFKDKEQGCSPLPVNFTSSSIQAGISGNHQYEKRVAGTSTWVPFTNSPSNNGAVSEVFSNTSDSVQIFEIRYNVFSDISNGTICYDTAAIDSLTVFPEFNSPTITGPDEICAFAQQIAFKVNPSDDANYQWSLPPGAFIINSTPTGDSINVNFSTFSGNVQVIEIDSNGCFGNPSLHPVSILTGPSGSLSLNGSNVICPGDSTSLIFNLSGPGTQNFDVVYNNGVSNDTLFNVANGHIEYVSPTNSTNYFLLSVEDRQYPNCNPSSISGSAFVSVNVKPTATLSGSTTICEGNNANLFFNLTGIGPWEVVYTDGNSNFTFNSNNPVTLEPVSPTDSTTYSLVSITDGNTPVCSGDVSGSATIEVNSKPTASISGSQNNVCVNTPTDLEINLTGTPPWNVRYTDGNNIFTLANVTPEAGFDSNTDTHTETVTISAAPGTKNYTLVDVIDSNTPNCSGDVSGSATITAFDRPQVEISGNSTICFGDNSPLTFNFTGDGPFDVVITANQDTVEYNNLQDGESISQTPEASTVYRVIELTDNRGCFGTSLGGPVSINVNNLPTSEISGDDVTCYGEETELIFDQTGAGPWTITYSNGSQNFTFTTSFNRHFEPVSPTVTTTYTLVSVVDSNSPDNCSGTVSGSVLKEVFPELEASFEATPENMILPESTVNITNNTTNKNEWEYEWDFGDGTISNEVDPAPHDYGIYGEFVIKMTATNGQCTDTYQSIVTIGAIPPIVDFDANPREGCLPLVVEFENLTQFADPSTYQWEFGDGQRVSAVENPTHVYRNPGIYTVTLSASNITGQRTQMIKEEFIEVFATPQASFTIPDEYRSVFTGEEVRFVNLSQGADEYIWKFGDGNESFEFEPIHAYPDSGLYDITLIAINSETGCTDSISLKSQVQVILGGESDVPNAFTPSRAGLGSASTNPLQNDFFLPRVEGVSQFNMKIYNRWGELLFESTSKDEGWDGYYNGVLMPQGVYVYRLELVYENGRRETKVGDITLIR